MNTLPNGEILRPHRAKRATRLNTWGEVALRYFDDFGWLVTPARAKIPCFNWNPIDLPAPPSREEQVAWWLEHHATMLTLITGARSRVIAIDADPRHGGSLETFFSRGWPRETPTARSGSCIAGDGGGHAFYQYPADGQPVPSAPQYAPGCEVKADGAVIVLAPSMHPRTYRHYEWLEGASPWNLPLATLPDAIITELRARNTSQTAIPHEYDVIDPSEHVYDMERTVELVTVLFNTALRKIDEGEHRNNVAVWLGMQLGTLRLTREELLALGDLYERTVRDVR